MSRRQNILDRHPLPDVETGHADDMPQKIVYDRSRRQEGPASPWIPFLKALKPGQSFIVANHTVGYVQLKTKELGIDIVMQDAPGNRFEKRIWIYGIEADRRPIIKRTVVQKKVVTEEILHG